MYNRIEVPLRPSHQLALLAAIPWLALGATLLLSGRPPWVIALAGILPVAGLWRDSRRLGLLRGTRAISALRTSGGEIEFLDSAGWQVASVKGTSRLFANGVLLTLKSRATGQRRTIVLSRHPLCTNTNPEALRRLQVWLRFRPKHRRGERASIH